jgi:hypothetical protein
MMTAFRAEIGAGIANPGLLAALPPDLVILRPVPAPSITRAFLLPAHLSPSARERLRLNHPHEEDHR